MLRLISLTALILGLSAQAAFAQDAKSKPVARLFGSFSPAAILPASTTAPVEPSEIEKRAFDQTNAVRQKNGLPALTWDSDVCRMARTHSESMSRQGYFSHVTPTGLKLKDRARLAGILQFSTLGENIGYIQGFDDPGVFVVGQWMQSTKHRENILSSKYRAMAIGSFVGPDGSVYLTQTFITR